MNKKTITVLVIAILVVGIIVGVCFKVNENKKTPTPIKTKDGVETMYSESSRKEMKDSIYNSLEQNEMSVEDKKNLIDVGFSSGALTKEEVKELYNKYNIR